MPSIEECAGLVRTLRERCLKHRTKAPSDPYLEKCLQACDILMGVNDPLNDNEAVKKWIESYTKAVLDLTYFEEDRLVQSDFNEDNGEQSLHQFLETLDGPVELTKKWNIEGEPHTIFGDELWECILWRKGAFLYMYCATCMEQQGRPQRNLQHFIKCCLDGVRYLGDMLRVRGPLLLARDRVSTNDESTFKLLLKGVYSDTHVLALMYAGELCHWYDTLVTLEIASQHDEFDPCTTGTHMLRTYIDVVIGPLKGQGWSTQRAQDLLMLLRSDSEAAEQLKQSTL